MVDIEKNKEEFMELLYKNVLSEINSDEKKFLTYGETTFLDFLENSDFFKAPASGQYHGNYSGGLCEHSLHVYHNLIKLEALFCAKFEDRYTLKTLTLVGLLHDVCKIGMYVESYRNKKKTDESGKDILVNGKLVWYQEPVWTIEDLMPLGHGEKSVIILMHYFNLSPEEIMAIRWHMGGYDALAKDFIGNMTINKACNLYPLITLLHMADLSSIFIESDEYGI
jgi:hypothetical protein